VLRNRTGKFLALFGMISDIDPQKNGLLEEKAISLKSIFFRNG
jgi:hypothetical protein